MFLLFVFCTALTFSEQTIAIPKIDFGVTGSTNPDDLVTSLQILLILTVLTLAPAIIIMTTYKNYKNIKSIQLPLKKMKKIIKLELFILSEQNIFNSLLNNLFTILPEHLIKHTDIYIYNIDNINNISLPHAKILIVYEKFVWSYFDR